MDEKLTHDLLRAAEFRRTSKNAAELRDSAACECGVVALGSVANSSVADILQICTAVLVRPAEPSASKN
jgi:hypothetical protein